MKKKNILHKVLFFLFVLLIASPFLENIQAIYPTFGNLIPISLFSLFLGIIFAITLGNPYTEKLGSITHNLLKISVVGMGFGTSVAKMIEIKTSSFYLVLFFVVIALIIGYAIGRILKVDSKTSDLITAGTSICGASAIAAVAPAIRSTSNQISVALGTVFILSGLGLFLFPMIGDYLDLTQEQFGVWAGLSMHDTASSIGAAGDFEVLRSEKGAESTALIIKLAKVIFIIPLVVLAAYFYKEKGAKLVFPYFIIFFLLAMIANYLFPECHNFFGEIKYFARKGLQITLFLIGANLSITNLKSVGIRPFLHGFALWILVAATSLFAIVSF